MTEAAIRAVLVRTQGPVNMGLACRLCANLDVELVFVDPLCDRDCKESRMFANKAKQTLVDAPVFNHCAEALADCDLVLATTARQRDAEWGKFLDLNHVNDTLNEWPAQKIAVLFGNESDGLNNDELALSHFFITLDTFTDYYSYNLSTAIGITLYQLRQQLKQNSNVKNDHELATHEQRQHLYDFWIGSLERIGYFPEHKAEWRQKHFQRLFQRIPLSKRDCDVFRGMLAQYEKFNPQSP